MMVVMQYCQLFRFRRIHLGISLPRPMSVTVSVCLRFTRSDKVRHKTLAANHLRLVTDGMQFQVLAALSRTLRHVVHNKAIESMQVSMRKNRTQPKPVVKKHHSPALNCKMKAARGRGVDPMCFSGSGPTHFFRSWVRMGIEPTHFLR